MWRQRDEGQRREGLPNCARFFWTGEGPYRLPFKHSGFRKTSTDRTTPGKAASRHVGRHPNGHARVKSLQLPAARRVQQLDMNTAGRIAAAI